MKLWHLAAIAAVAVGVLYLQKQAKKEAGQAGLERGDPRGTIMHAAEVLTKGAKGVAEDAKKQILGETKANQRETDKKRRVGG